ncbi:hypothetical protein GCM10010267_40930 [Streptomyces griseorubens]|nr:hypothetical protein GCM10010267_40930 [Streptomyces griseorubens]
MASRARVLSGIVTPAIFSLMAASNGSGVSGTPPPCGDGPVRRRSGTADNPSETDTRVQRRTPEASVQGASALVEENRCRYRVGETPRWRANARRRLS